MILNWGYNLAASRRYYPQEMHRFFMNPGFGSREDEDVVATRNGYLALLSSFGMPANMDQQMHLEMLNFFDDRRWPVRVFYHDQLPRWVSKSQLASHVVYGLRLLFSRAATLIVEHSLFPYLVWNLFWSRITSRRILVTVNDHASILGNSLTARLHRFALRRTDMILVDSRQNLDLLSAAGIPGEKIRVLPRGAWIPLSEPLLPSLMSRHPGWYHPQWKKIRKKFGQLIGNLSE